MVSLLVARLQASSQRPNDANASDACVAPTQNPPQKRAARSDLRARGLGPRPTSSKAVSRARRHSLTRSEVVRAGLGGLPEKVEGGARAAWDLVRQGWRRCAQGLEACPRRFNPSPKARRRGPTSPRGVRAGLGGFSDNGRLPIAQARRASRRGGGLALKRGRAVHRSSMGCESQGPNAGGWERRMDGRIQ